MPNSVTWAATKTIAAEVPHCPSAPNSSAVEARRIVKAMSGGLTGPKDRLSRGSSARLSQSMAASTRSKTVITTPILPRQMAPVRPVMASSVAATSHHGIRSNTSGLSRARWSRLDSVWSLRFRMGDLRAVCGRSITALQGAEGVRQLCLCAFRSECLFLSRGHPGSTLPAPTRCQARLVVASGCCRRVAEGRTGRV